MFGGNSRYGGAATTTTTTREFSRKYDSSDFGGRRDLETVSRTDSRDLYGNPTVGGNMSLTQTSTSASLPAELKVISCDMPDEMQNGVLSVVQENLTKFDKQKDVAKAIKQALDIKFERLWHVVMVQGQYWNFVSHEPGYCFNFKLGRNIFMIWRTPGY